MHDYRVLRELPSLKTIGSFFKEPFSFSACFCCSEATNKLILEVSLGIET